MNSRLLAVLLPLLLSVAAPLASQAREAGLLVIAHRGGVVDDARPEDSVPALEAAIRRGYTHVEVDLRATKDGHAVCLHDRSLKRTTGVDVNIDEVTLAQLYTLVKPELVPTFEAFAARSAGHVNLMPDVKDVPPALAAAFKASVGDTLRKYGLINGALFIGSAEIGRTFVGPARLSWRKSLADFQKEVASVPGESKKYFAFNHPKDFNQADVDGFHKLGVSVIITVNTLHYPTGDPIQQGLDGIDKVMKLGVDGLQIDSVYDAKILPAKVGQVNASTGE